MAIFSWKRGEQASQSAGDKGDGAPAPSPESAAKFFQRAQTVHDTSGYEYAMQMWLSGLRFDPGNLQGIEGFFTSASAFLNESGGKRPAKEIDRTVGGRNDVDRFLSALLEWAMKPTEPALAVKAAEGAAALSLAEAGKWVGDRALGFAVRDKKPRKDLLIRLMGVFEKLGIWERAVQAGEFALKLDIADGDLGAHVRNLAAQATMTKGGFVDAGKAGGFRAGIKDAERQRQLEEGDRVVKTAETIDRLIQAAEEDFAKRPEDVPATETLFKRLLERGRPEDEHRALEIAIAAFERTHSFRFRQAAGDLKMRQARRALSQLKRRVEAAPADESLKDELRRAEVDLLRAEVEEFRIRIEAYPTDLGLRFELARRYFELGEYHDAIELFQGVQGEGKYRAPALNYMAQSFLKIDYVDEAIETYRNAADLKDLLPDVALEIRYGLMSALEKKASADRDLAIAAEADRIASSIAMQNLGYRDIRARRESIKKLVAELKAKGPA